MTVTPDAAAPIAPVPPLGASDNAAENTASSTRNFVLFLLLIVYISNYADRQILNVLQVPIMKELGITNTGWGLLAGTTFAVFYATLGIPIAMLADRVSRKWILTLSLIAWSAMTTVCGLAGTVTQLVSFRIGVGVGEAGGSPPSHSMIADLFPQGQRATALAIYALGVPLGASLGSLIGGYVGGWLGWRAAFFVLGVPGLILAFLVARYLREPPRGHSDGAAGSGKASGVIKVARFMLSQRSLVHTIAGATLMTMTGYAGLAFFSKFLVDSHHLTQSQVGLYQALLTGVAGTIGTFAGGYLADVFSKRDIRWNTRVVTVAIILAAPFALAAYLLSDTKIVLWLLPVVSLVGGLYLGPTFTVTQNLVGVNMRSTASALLLFVINFIGYGLGPLIVGKVSDLLIPIAGTEAVRYALLLFSSLNLWAAWHYWVAPRTLQADLDRAAALT